MKRLIGAHRKAGSTWMKSIFEEIGNRFAISDDIIFREDSEFYLKNLTDYKGVHLVRDFRDIIVSGCFYHATANEKWLSKPLALFDGLSYKEKINSFDTLEDRIIFEMKHAGRTTISEIKSWIPNPNFLEIKYEDLINDVNLELFTKIFKFLEFPEQWMEDLLKIAYKNSVFSVEKPTDLNDHVRDSRPDQWKTYFTDKCYKEFDNLMEDMSKRINLLSLCCTTVCNGGCAFCSRKGELFKTGVISNNLNLDLTVLFPILHKVDFISLNGAYGDAIHNPTLMKLLKRCRKYNIHTEIATNGGAKKSEFWSELGKIENLTVVFALDGLEDTHHRYRKTDFHTVFNNMKTFIENGGSAIWQYILFDYNEHQVAQASELAKSIGCQEFKTIRSNIYNEEFKRPKTNIHSREELIETNKVDYCYWRFRDGKPFRSIAIDVMGYVHPCCHISYYSPFDIDNPKYAELKELFLKDKDRINLYKNSDIEDIINCSYFQYVYNNFPMKFCDMKCGGTVIFSDEHNKDFKEDQPKTVMREK